MTTALPEPIAVPWTMKTLESAKTSVDIEDGGRMHLAIEHDVIHGVSPEMLLWWFRNMHGTIEIEGHAYPRYRVWHPLDHVAHRYVRTSADGQAGPGSVFHIHEVFARNPAWEIDVWTDVTRRLRHNVEEVGSFEHFLPALHASAHGRTAVRTGVHADVRAR